MHERQPTDRRTVLRSIGAGVVAGAVLSSPAAADPRRRSGLGEFLNAEAQWKDRPLWDSGVTEATAASDVAVRVGVLTSLDIPDEEWPFSGDPPEQGPFSFEPQVVKVSPGTTVTWNWVVGHHSVTSFNVDADVPDDHGSEFDKHGEAPHTATHTFEEEGTYLYFCHPHGTPYPMFFPGIGNEPNHLGMRGAVIVEGKEPRER